MGRFVSEDPIQDGANWYAFAGNDPVNFADPSGLSQAGHPLAGGFSGGKTTASRLPAGTTAGLNALLGGGLRTSVNVNGASVLGGSVRITPATPWAAPTSAAIARDVLFGLGGADARPATVRPLNVLSSPIGLPALGQVANPLDRQVAQGSQRSAGINSFTVERLADARQAERVLLAWPQAPSLNTQLNGAIVPVTREQSEAGELRYLVNKPTLTLAEQSRIETLSLQQMTTLDKVDAVIGALAGFAGGPAPRGGSLNVYGAGPQAFTSRTRVPAPSKLVPNPNGRIGNAATQAKTQEVIGDLRERGFTSIRLEAPFQPGSLGSGHTRYADVVAGNPVTGQTEIIQIGRTIKSDPRVPVIRERQALDDIIFSPTIRRYNRLLCSV